MDRYTFRDFDRAFPTARGTRETYGAWSTVDGKLDVLSLHRQPYFVIYEHGTDNRIRCVFPDDWLTIVKDYMGFRVRAEGYVNYRRDGSATSLINPTAMERVPEPKESDITRYRGSLPGITGDLSSYEYVRQMRDNDA